MKMTPENTLYKKRSILILLLCLLTTSIYARYELKLLTDSLDIIVENKSLFTAQKEQRINHLIYLLKSKDSSLEYEYEINRRLYDEYKKFQLDSAIQYINRNLEIAESIGDNRLVNTSLIQLTVLYSYAGRYLEAERILMNINVNSLEENLIADYYEAYCNFFSHYAANTSQNKYYQQSHLYQDTLLTVLDSSSYRYKINLAQKHLNHRQADRAETILLELLEKEKMYSPEFAMITYLLGNVNGIKQNIRQEKVYYTLSAIADGKNSLKDNASFQSLASVYYDEGNIFRALKYTQSAIEDAIFCNIQFRTAQLSGFYSIITTSYQTKEAKAKSQLQFYLLLISMLTLFLMLSIAYVYRQMKKVSGIKEELSQANNKLIDLNKEMNTANHLLNEKNIQLSEANNIKEQYIGHFFNLCSTYINKLEDYRKTLQKTAMNKQIDELFKLLKSNTLVDNELEELYKNFDTIFLNLYPTFVTDFNSLLVKEEQINLRSKDLLNKELRIYALLRLGISDSTKIATFLRCSLSTVYNYRTKMRNKAVVSRDEFEDIVMKIGTIQKKE